MGDRISMKLDYRRVLCLRCSIFNSNRIRGHRGLEGETEILKRNLGKRLEWRYRNET